MSGIITVMWLLVVGAFVAAIMSAIGKCPLWVSVILLCIIVALQVLPLK
jgi:hypothetical protein